MLAGVDTERAHTTTSGAAGAVDAAGAALPPIGAQLSTAGGFLPVLQRALDVGAEVVQIFNTNPRIWKTRVPAPGEVEAFAEGLQAHGLRLVFHSTYLINLASPDEELQRRSSTALSVALAMGATAGAEAVVVHVGSHRGEVAEAERRVIASLGQAVTMAESLDARPLPALLLETGAGAGNTLGGRLEELQTLLCLEEAVGLDEEVPLGICIDTAHLFASGYALHDEAGFADTMERLRELGLLERIRLVHLNDSKTELGVKRDVHENLGLGIIGYEGLARVVQHPALRRVPFVLEVPGLDGHGPDAYNMTAAKSMRAGLPAPARPPAPAV
jgi:deoxyribonuclease IV